MADHDWRKIMHENDHDDEDCKSYGSVMFWVGAISGSVGTLLLCLLIGLYYNNWQLP